MLKNHSLSNVIALEKNNWAITLWRWDRWTHPGGYHHPAMIQHGCLLVWCETGSATYYLGAEVFRVKPGTLAFIPEERAFFYRVDIGSPYQHCTIHFDLKDAHGISPSTLNLVPRSCSPSDHRELQASFLLIESQLGRNNQASNLRASAAAMQILAILVEKSPQRKPTLNQSVGKAYEALAIMEKRFRGSLSIKEIANELHVTPEYLAVSFRKTFQLTPKLQIRNLRLTYAASLLFTTDKAIKEIATETGFRSLSVFEEAFRSYFKCRPSQLSQKIRHQSGPEFVYRPEKS